MAWRPTLDITRILLSALGVGLVLGMGLITDPPPLLIVAISHEGQRRALGGGTALCRRQRAMSPTYRRTADPAALGSGRCRAGKPDGRGRSSIVGRPELIPGSPGP